ncbi:hypothetical protein ROG8370_02873 [Roseovarius gaetbuli]|uniref:DDE domain-containing protein n=1 Tax=Roseovarius gaetbuli TaxID=1356575 RepID=A0A1X6ZVW2_9RHOB|nr:hypothetical protein ROG8370_02873 [Roseovarius gaetbuli]
MKCTFCHWHLDEKLAKFKGERNYLWHATDHESEVLESFMKKTRNKKAALKFFKKVMRKHCRPEVFATDRLRSFGAALKEIGVWQTGMKSTVG